MKGNTIFILRAERPGFRFWQLQNIWLSPKFLPATVGQPASYSVGTVSSLPRTQCQERETDHTLPSNAEIMNVWSQNHHRL